MSPKPWFRKWFGKEYLDLYPHRDVEEAREAVRLLLETTRPPAGARVLDLACGAGRHLAELAGADVRATGLDLSATLLEQARAASPHTGLVRSDMRKLPFADGSFDLVTSFFTSFGYFEDPRDDARVLGESRRVLSDRGHLLLDFLNADKVRAGLEPYDVREVNGTRIHQERRLIEGGTVVQKQIRIEDGAGPGRTFTERVRLYPPEELQAML
ncbi:MAG: class I SAM-dependent methyltransferase, partial [Gemmatimonadota bacterium]